MKTGSSTAAPDQQMVEENPENHPAVEAWLALDKTNRKPDAVTALFKAGRKRKKKNKSAVYKLENARQPGITIVAKRAKETRLRVERLIYESILPKLPVSSLEYYGSIEVGGEHWLFIEYANGVEWQFRNEAHCDLAIKWLAEMHYSSVDIPELSQLPERSAKYYQSRLEEAKLRIKETISNPTLYKKDVQILYRFLKTADSLDSRWKEIECLVKPWPTTLLHNDFAKKNIHVRSAQNRPLLLPFDWEYAGRGTPVVDLSWMFLNSLFGALSKYHQHLGNLGIDIDREAFKLTAAIGAIFRIADSINWSSRYLSTSVPRKQISYVHEYSNNLANAMAYLGWPH